MWHDAHWVMKKYVTQKEKHPLTLSSSFQFQRAVSEKKSYRMKTTNFKISHFESFSCTFKNITVASNSNTYTHSRLTSNHLCKVSFSKKTHTQGYHLVPLWWFISCVLCLLTGYKLCGNSSTLSISCTSFCIFNTMYPLLLIWHLELIDLPCDVASLIKAK